MWEGSEYEQNSSNALISQYLLRIYLCQALFYFGSDDQAKPEVTNGNKVSLLRQHIRKSYENHSKVYVHSMGTVTKTHSRHFISLASLSL